MDRNRRYVSLSKVKKGICELASRIFPVQKFQHKIFRMQLLTYRKILSTTEPFRENSGTGPNDFQTTDAMWLFSKRRRRRTCSTKTRLSHLCGKVRRHMVHATYPHVALNWHFTKECKPPARQLRKLDAESLRHGEPHHPPDHAREGALSASGELDRLVSGKV